MWPRFIAKIKVSVPIGSSFQEDPMISFSFDDEAQYHHNNDHQSYVSINDNEHQDLESSIKI